MHDAKPMALMVASEFSDLPLERVALKRIDRSDKLVWLLAAICRELSLSRPLYNVLVSDGRSGHTVLVAGLNGLEFVHPRGVDVTRSWFCFHDPWAARSLLAPERNFNGVQALENISRPPLWLISPADLQKIIVGFQIPVDLMPYLNNAFLTLDLLSLDHDGSRPFWYDSPGLPDVPFAGLLSQSKGITPISLRGALGLAQVQFMLRNLNEAIGWLETGYEIDPLEAATMAVELLRGYDHPQLAQQWMKRLHGL